MRVLCAMVSVEATSVEGMSDAMKEEVKALLYEYVKKGEMDEAIRTKITTEWDRLYDDKTRRTVDNQWESIHNQKMLEQLQEAGPTRMQQAEDAGVAKLVEKVDAMEETLFKRIMEQIGGAQKREQESEHAQEQ